MYTYATGNIRAKQLVTCAGTDLHLDLNGTVEQNLCLFVKSTWRLKKNLITDRNNHARKGLPFENCKEQYIKGKRVGYWDGRLSYNCPLVTK